METYETQATRRSYRWWRPPTCGMAMTCPISGGCTGRSAGVSLASEVRPGFVIIFGAREN